MIECPTDWLGKREPFFMIVDLTINEVQARILGTLKPIGIIDELTMAERRGFVGELNIENEFRLQVEASDFRQFYPFLVGRMDEADVGTVLIFQTVADPMLKFVFWIGAPITAIVSALSLWTGIALIWALPLLLLFAFYFPIQFLVHRARYRDVLEKFWALFAKECIDHGELSEADDELLFGRDYGAEAQEVETAAGDARFGIMKQVTREDDEMTNDHPDPPHDDLPPIGRAELKALFDYLDQPAPVPCTHTMKETIAFLRKGGLPVEQTVEWLHENGAGCDCEVIFNVDGEWGEWAGRILEEE